MNLILFGFKRSGKTTYGKALSKVLKWPFLDIDDLIIQAYKKEHGPKKEIYEIYEALGDEKFRALEKEAVLKIDVSRFIISVGGGTLLKEACHKHLKKIGTLIYLKRPKEQVKRALSLGRIPSFLDRKDFDASFEQMYAHRRPLYESLADKTLDVSQLTENEVIEALVECAHEIEDLT